MNKPICAVASVFGYSAIAVIRFSGNNSLALVEKIFTPKFKAQAELKNFARKSILGNLIHQNQILDEVMVIPFLKDASYTGEESGEIHCHGNPLIVQNILQALFAVGFLPARGGEFTQRAYQHGRMDLTQAQAVNEIISARGERELQNALFLMRGGFREKLFLFRSALLNLLADVSAELDFADEDIEFVSAQSLQNSLRDLYTQVKTLQQNSIESERLRKGVEIALSGAPNSGKSSLLNYLMGQNRSLVSSLPGTTRDYIETEMQIDGVPIKLVDTAGIRKSGQGMNEIEEQGIALSLQKARYADVVFVLLDASLSPHEALSASPLEILLQDFQKNETQARAKKIYPIVNKMDLAGSEWKNFDNTKLEIFFSQHYSFYPAPQVKSFFSLFVPLSTISILQKQNLSELHHNLKNFVQQFVPHEQGLMLSAWQRERLETLRDELNHSLLLAERNQERELIAASLNLSLHLLGELSGEITNEEILGRVFSRFCIGK